MRCVGRVLRVEAVPGYNKYRVFMDCGHTILLDGSVDNADMFTPKPGNAIYIKHIGFEPERSKRRRRRKR